MCKTNSISFNLGPFGWFFIFKIYLIMMAIGVISIYNYGGTDMMSLYIDNMFYLNTIITYLFLGSFTWNLILNIREYYINKKKERGG